MKKSCTTATNNGICDCQESKFCTCSLNNGPCYGQFTPQDNSSLTCSLNNGNCNCGKAENCACSIKSCCVIPNYTNFTSWSSFSVVRDPLGCVRTSTVEVFTIPGKVIAGIILGILAFIAFLICMCVKCCCCRNTKTVPILIQSSQVPPNAIPLSPPQQQSNITPRTSEPPPPNYADYVQSHQQKQQV